MLTSNSKQQQATYQKCAARKLTKNKSPGVSIWKNNHVRKNKDKAYNSNTQGELYIWYKEKESSQGKEVRNEERVLFKQCMMHETRTQWTTSNRRANWITDATETQNPIETQSRRLPTDVTVRQTQKGPGRRRGIWNCIRNLNSYIRNAWKKIKLRPASHVSRLIP